MESHTDKKKHHVGFYDQPWELLFPNGLEDLGGDKPKPRPPDRTIHNDVKILPAKDMAMFGKNPADESIVTIVCLFCGRSYLPQAFRRHVQIRHSDEPDLPRTVLPTAALKTKSSKKLSPQKKTPKSTSTSPPESNDEDSNITIRTESEHGPETSATRSTLSQSFRRNIKQHTDDSSTKSISSSSSKIAKKLSPQKKISKSASSSPPELTEELSKDSRKSSSKSKKCKSPIPPELEPMLPTSKRMVIQAGPPELLPVELPKRSSKKKIERKADKVYDPNKNCGVINKETGKPCLRSILCKVHLVALKRAVPNRAIPYDALTKLLKTQNDDDKRPRIDIVPAPIPTLVSNNEVSPVCALTVAANEVCTEQSIITQVEPPAKRFKTEETVENEFIPLSPKLSAFIEAALMNQEESALQPTVIIPRPEPIVRWNLDTTQFPEESYSPPPYFQLEDIPWHSSHPRPLATNTFGCRLVGGLLSRSKKLDSVRKHLDMLWSSQGSFNDTTNKLPGFTAKQTSTTLLKKTLLPTSAPRRKPKSSGGSDTLSSLLQRTTQPTTNGVPLRLFQGNLQQPTFLQFNLCPSK